MSYHYFPCGRRWGGGVNPPPWILSSLDCDVIRIPLPDLNGKKLPPLQRCTSLSPKVCLIVFLFPPCPLFYLPSLCHSPYCFSYILSQFLNFFVRIVRIQAYIRTVKCCVYVSVVIWIMFTQTFYILFSPLKRWLNRSRFRESCWSKYFVYYGLNNRRD